MVGQVPSDVGQGSSNRDTSTALHGKENGVRHQIRFHSVVGASLHQRNLAVFSPHGVCCTSQILSKLPGSPSKPGWVSMIFANGCRQGKCEVFAFSQRVRMYPSVFAGALTWARGFIDWRRGGDSNPTVLPVNKGESHGDSRIDSRNSIPSCPDLTQVVTAWAKLSAPIKAAILALVRTAS